MRCELSYIHYIFYTIFDRKHIFQVLLNVLILLKLILPKPLFVCLQ